MVGFAPHSETLPTLQDCDKRINPNHINVLFVYLPVISCTMLYNLIKEKTMTNQRHLKTTQPPLMATILPLHVINGL